MGGVALRDLGQQYGAAIGHRNAKNADIDAGLDGIPPDFNQQPFQIVQLRAGHHPLHRAVIGNAAQQDAAAGVGEGANLVGQVITARRNRTVALESNLLEFPGAVLAEAQSLLNFFGGVRHCNAIGNGQSPTPAAAPAPGWR